jgi:cytochrome c peroxidase
MIRSLTVITVLSLFAAPAFAAGQWQALPKEAPAPADNPTTEAKVELGRKLYFDPRLSSTGTVSCNSCHNVMEAGHDARRVSLGVHGQAGHRNSPTVWNAAFLSVQFWDGRADTLEDQAKGPVIASVEMGMDSHEAVAERVREITGYEPHFKEAFGDEGITMDTIAKAIAAFERTLITPNTPYDQYVRGDKSALTDQQERGMKAFAQNGCTSCHSGATFAGPKMPLGTGFYQKFPTYTDNEYVEQYDFMEDKGRAEVTGKEQHKHMWRVPTLRNVALTAPYFHNGSVDTLEEAIRVMGKTQLNRDLDEQTVDDIAAFLESLGGTFPEVAMPRLPTTDRYSVVTADPGETAAEGASQ